MFLNYFNLNNKYSENNVHEVAADPLEGRVAAGKVKSPSSHARSQKSPCMVQGLHTPNYKVKN